MEKNPVINMNLKYIHELLSQINQAVQNDQFDVGKKILLELQNNLTNEKNKDLFLLLGSINNNLSKLLEFYIKVGINVKLSDETGCNLLHIAVSTGDWWYEQQVLREEFGEGSYPDDFTEDLEDNYKIIQLLLDAGVKVNERDKLNKLPINYTSSQKVYDLLKSYLDKELAEQAEQSE